MGPGLGQMNAVATVRLKEVSIYVDLQLTCIFVYIAKKGSSN